MARKRERASDLLARAAKAQADRKLSDHRRAYEHSALMARWATAKIEEDPNNALRWSQEASEWSKRELAALNKLDQEKLDEIQRAIEAFRRDGDALVGLH